MADSTVVKRGSLYSRLIASVRGGPFAGTWLFAWVFLSQLGHLIEHIAVAIQGEPLLGPQFDSEVSHLVFNGLIAAVSLLLVAVYPRNPWVYPLAAIAVFHGIEHVYIFEQFMRTGLTNGPGLLGQGGAIGLIPLDRLDLHNNYNGLEVVFIVLGFWNECEAIWTEKDSEACDREFVVAGGFRDARTGHNGPGGHGTRGGARWSV